MRPGEHDEKVQKRRKTARARGAASINRQLTTPDKPNLGRDWPKVKAADGTEIPADPMVVLMRRR